MVTRDVCKAHIEKLIGLLEAEITQLRNGEFSSLQDQTAAKLEGINQLTKMMRELTSEEDKSTLSPLISRLNRLSNENGVLLKSMYNGSRAAQARLQSLQQEEAKVGVYDRQGGSVTLTDGYPLTEKTV